MSNFTVEEINLMCVFEANGRIELIEDIGRVLPHLDDRDMEVTYFTNTYPNTFTPFNPKNTFAYPLNCLATVLMEMIGLEPCFFKNR